MKSTKKQSYAQAMERLEELVTQMESNQLDVDHLLDAIQEATALVEFCTHKLTKADEEVKEFLQQSGQSDK